MCHTLSQTMEIQQRTRESLCSQEAHPHAGVSPHQEINPLPGSSGVYYHSGMFTTVWLFALLSCFFPFPAGGLPLLHPMHLLFLGPCPPKALVESVGLSSRPLGKTSFFPGHG